MKNIGILTDEKRSQIEKFYKSSKRYIEFLCYCYAKYPMITKEDLISSVDEKLCVYAVRHNIIEYGHQGLAKYLVKTAYISTIKDKYHSNVTTIEKNNDLYFDSIISKDLNLVNNMIEGEYNNRLIKIKLSVLKDFERRYIIDYYIKGLNMPEIAKFNNVSTQYVSAIIKQSVKKITK